MMLSSRNGQIILETIASHSPHSLQISCRDDFDDGGGDGEGDKSSSSQTVVDISSEGVSVAELLIEVDRVVSGNEAGFSPGVSSWAVIC